MINRLIEFSLKNRFLILLAYVLLAGWGYWALLKTPIDAIPDLSENQVIVFTDWPGRSPQEVEDQITYPLTVNLQGLPGVKTVRSSSAFGFSMINIIFEDDVDVYFARTRVLERLNLASELSARRRRAHAGPGCDRRRPGVLVHGRRPVRSGHAALAAGLVHPLSAQFRSGRRGSRQHRRLRPAVSDRRRSRQSCAPSTFRCGRCLKRCSAATTTSAQKSSKPNDMEYVVRGLGLIESAEGHRRHRPDLDERHAGLRAQRRSRPTRTGIPARRSRQRRDGCRRRRRHHSLRRQCAAKSSTRSKQRSRRCSRACRKACTSFRSTTAAR